MTDYYEEKHQRDMWLKKHQTHMTKNEYEQYWELIRTILGAEVEMDRLYEKMKKELAE